MLGLSYFEIETELNKAEKLSLAEKYEHKMALVINFRAKSGINFLFYFYKKKAYKQGKSFTLQTWKIS